MIDFFWKKDNKPFLVLDIGEDSIKSLILKKEKNNLILLGNAAEEYDEFNIKENILNCAERAYKNFIFFSTAKERKGRGLKDFPVLLGLPSSILKTRVILCRLERKSSLKISKSEQKQITEKIVQTAKNQVKEEFVKYFNVFPFDVKWLGFKLLETKINGYPVSNLNGFTGRDLDFKVLTTCLPQNYFKNIINTLNDLNLKVRKITNMAEVMSGADQKVSYPRDLNNIKGQPEALKDLKYVPSLLMSYYAKEIF